ncbi:hypothetical protein SOVF_169500 [Spinacia oleracea]|uniref:Saposin B-type domain-containing protein n=1 Tax=Spinacia oleracea TaxID=3562 RepID=A0A9R0J3B0_SPIOL|nr:uncharacterized protein LOC110799490 [Spinacia oleracea]KNA07700.1 hypothetical protein SOVF_169500 [Spinacia oleracea]
MAKHKKQTLFPLNLALLIIIIAVSSAQIAECLKKPEASARKQDIPFIKCQVCQKLASQLYSQVQKNKDAQISPKKITEYEVIEIVENVCNLKKEESDWISKIDIVEKGDQLELVDQDVEGHCNSKCKTIERACQEIVGFSDTDIAEYIYARKPQLDSLVNYLCKDLTEACNKRPPPVPKDRVPGEPFVPKPAKEAEMEKMMRSMQGLPGAPGMKMYSREELTNNMQNLGGEDVDVDEDDDDDDDEAQFRSNLGKAFKEKAKKKIKKDDWKETVMKQVTDTGKTLKKHANRVSHRLRKWWRSKTSAAPKKKSTGNKAEL